MRERGSSFWPLRRYLSAAARRAVSSIPFGRRSPSLRMRRRRRQRQPPSKIYRPSKVRRYRRDFTAAAFALLTGVALGACGAAGVVARRHAEEANAKSAIEAEFTQVKHDCDSRMASPAVDPIRDDIQIDISKPTPFRLLVITATASPSQQQAIVAWSDARAACAEAAHRMFANLPLPESMSPELQQQARFGLARFVDQSLEASNILAAPLYDGQISFGEFNKKRAELRDQMQAQLKLLLSALDAQDKAEVMARAQAAQQQLVATIEALRAVGCATARGRFARAMCE